MNVSPLSTGLEPGPTYWERRAQIAGEAAGPERQPATIDYTEAEHHVWSVVASELHALWRTHAATAALEGLASLDLDVHRVPQLTEVTDRLEPLSGFRFEAVPGLVETGDFFAGLASSRFLSTQYVRWEGIPLYTPEPDVIHEVFGHAHVLACPQLADLHRAAGRAFCRLETVAARQFVADVFWFSAEFGVVQERGRWCAYGAGLLSSSGELSRFAAEAAILPLDPVGMGTIGYDIHAYQPRLFGAGSLDEAVDTVGGFFESCSDDSIAAMQAASSLDNGGTS